VLVKIAALVTVLLAAAGVLGSAPAALAQPAGSPAPRTITSRLPFDPSLAGGPGQRHTAPPPARGRYRTISVPHAAQTTPEDVTNSGMIVGCYQPAAGPTRGFTDRGGRFTTITDPAASHRSQVRGCVVGANSRGVLVGYYLTASGAERAFTDRGGHFTPVDAPGAGRRPGQGTIAVDINDSGVVAGYYTGRHGKYGFVLRRGRFTIVRYPPGSRSTWASGVADNGTIAGGYTSRLGVLHGFLDAGGVFSPIAVPGAPAGRGKGTAPACISKHSGLVVGNYWRRGRSSRPVGFSYQHGAYRTLSDPAATQGTEPQCGNDGGQIVGVYYTGGGAPHGFEFTPR
jgi:hypothetical protein